MIDSVEAYKISFSLEHRTARISDLKVYLLHPIRVEFPITTVPIHRYQRCGSLSQPLKANQELRITKPVDMFRFAKLRKEIDKAM